MAITTTNTTTTTTTTTDIANRSEGRASTERVHYVEEEYKA